MKTTSAKTASRPTLIGAATKPHKATPVRATSILGNFSLRRLLDANIVQAKLHVSQPGDRYEAEADRLADQVMRMPAPACACGGTCDKCSGRAAPVVQRRAADGAPGAETPAPHAPDAVGRAGIGGDLLRSLGAGRPLDAATRAWFEPRFGVDFDDVRVHSGPRAAASARAIGAFAYTFGRDLVFGAGQYSPTTFEGRRLLAHELTHVVQQQRSANRSGDRRTAADVRTAMPAATIAGDWIIDNHSHRHTPSGPTDASLVGAAFGTICGLAGVNGNRIQIGQGPPTADNMEGCRCLWDIENDLISPTPVLNGTPHIRLDEHGWSHTNPAASPPFVAARHPQSEFEWGYWTAGQTRHVKPFWQTVAHEVCGHVAAFVRSHGTTAGGRGSGTGHNEAIQGENVIVGEHGVPVSEQRGLDINPRTGAPMAGHRGESFLQAVIADFAHGSDTPPASAAAVIGETIASIRAVRSTVGLDLFVQVQGHAYRNEGGTALAGRRAANVRANILTALRAASISTSFPQGGTTLPRFQPDISTLIPGSSHAGVSDRNRRVHVYLFHKPHSAGP